MRVLLAGKADVAKLKFPVWASPKLDGIRAVVKDGRLLSRSMKPIPNEVTQSLFGRPSHEGLDGELIVGPPTAPNVLHVTSGAIRAREGTPLVTFYVFDLWNVPDLPFRMRYDLLRKKVERLPGNVRLVEQVVIRNAEELEWYEEKVVMQGYEGVMLRDPEAPYKYGRSTTNEGILLKMKRFTEEEAEIIGYEEEMQNTNEAKRNQLGLLERSSSKQGKKGKGTLGALIARNPKTGQEFRIGTGFSAKDRKEFWEVRDSLLGKTVKFKHFEYGAVDRPRHSVFLALRDEWDM